MIPRPIRLIATALAVATLATGCGSDDDRAADGTPVASTGTTADAGPAASFPVTVEAGNGPVTIAEAPRRIVSLSASVTEVLFAIDAGPQVVAVDQHSDFPAGVPTTDLSGFRPNIEAIGGYEPDLVVVSSDRDGVVTALAGVGIPVLLLSSPDDLDGLYDHVGVLGAATGRVEEADALVARMAADIEALADSVPARPRPVRYLYELSDSFHSATSDTFIGSLLALVGLESIADGADPANRYPQLSAEYVLAADPDAVLLAHTDGASPDPQAVAARPGWSDLGAVRTGHVVPLDADIASRWGPRVVDLLRQVVDATSDLAAP